MPKILSNIKNGVKTAASGAKRKTKNVANATKLKLEIKLEESNLDQCFEQLGRAVFANSQTGENQKKIDELLAKAQAISDTIKDYKSKLALIKGKIVCPYCEAVIDADGPCEFCNEKIVANEKPTENEANLNENADNVDEFQVEIVTDEDEGKENEDCVLVVDDEDE